MGRDPGAQITNQRRSALATAYAYDQAFGPGLASATKAGLLAYHDTLPGPTGPARALPLNLPARAKLVAAHYNALEDFDGATVAELGANVPTLSTSEAAAVLRALGYT